MDFFDKYRLQDVGPTRARLAELISIFDAQHHEMTVAELDDLREEMERLMAQLQEERERA